MKKKELSEDPTECSYLKCSLGSLTVHYWTVLFQTKTGSSVLSKQIREMGANAKSETDLVSELDAARRSQIGVRVF